MPLTVLVGAPVTCRIVGHSASNGAPFPDGSTVTVTSSDPTIATVPATVPPTSGGMSEIDVPVTGVAAGSCSISVVVTAPDGTVFNGADSLIEGAPIPGLTHIVVTLTSP